MHSYAALIHQIQPNLKQITVTGCFSWGLGGFKMASMAPAGGGGGLITLITPSLDQIILGGWAGCTHPISTLATGEDTSLLIHS